jgi:hypothetical protein
MTKDYPEAQVTGLYIRSTLHSRASQFATLELVHNLLHGDPLHTLMSVDPLDKPLVQEDDLWLAAHLRMNTDGKDEASIFGAFAVQEFKLLFPQALDYRGIDKTVCTWLGKRQLKWRPVVQMPVGGYFDD